MAERFFMPALTFTTLAAALAAFTAEIVQSNVAQPQLVQLERVVITATRELPATPLARADADRASVVVAR
jgi:hypothetical protein